MPPESSASSDGTANSGVPKNRAFTPSPPILPDLHDALPGRHGRARLADDAAKGGKRVAPGRREIRPPPEARPPERGRPAVPEERALRKPEHSRIGRPVAERILENEVAGSGAAAEIGD